ncbi:site-2 protease family protein [Archangium lansingense]|uniref:Site-2 protease family protein n=1 Tax=Archangium lansingense TaxID=2995310 RepID=A0ABT4AIX4_9BACT|nr:site-2 protease family protein [Archangium lansinium]MCY1081645.1 site-2 protease family protein [Archangium lansinium]
MLRFRLGTIPVEVHLSHLLCCALLGALGVSDMLAMDLTTWTLDPHTWTRDLGLWPARQLLEGGPGYGRTALLVFLAGLFVLSSTVLAHESGHALMLRALGYRPSISLAWLGGITRHNSLAPIPWHQQVMIAAAGPLSGLSLSLTALVLLHSGVSRNAEGLRVLLSWLCVSNLLWALFNLLPVPTLDGGNIVSALATRFFGQTGFMGAQWLALVVCLLVMAYAFAGDPPNPLLGILFGMMGLHALRLLLAVLRGDMKVSSGVAPPPLVQEMQQAEAALAAGRLEEARQRGLAVLDSEECTPDLASRAHHLLGWAALKNGQGRASLDHFSQVRRRPVETHALAAAFSLLGDELRALALWEMAWQETHNRTVLHEYAGSLIRSERVQKALRLPGVEPEAAFLCAQRPLFIRGAYSEAAALCELGLVHTTSARLAYDAACAHARARHLNDAMRMLRRATELGFQDIPYAASDDDLAPLHGHPDFEQWLAVLQKSATA